MLATAVRRTAQLALSGCAGGTPEMLSIIPQHSPPVATSKAPRRKAILKKADAKRKTRAKPEEKTLSWWLDQSDPLELFQANDAHRVNDRRKLLGRVQTVIRKHFGMPYTVATFGSVRYGASSAKSDMDLIILDKERMGGFDPSKRRLSRIYNITSVAGQLKHAGFTAVETIPASVPIVKFKDPKTGIHCDLNVNEQPGYWNSIMLQRYAALCPHLPGLLLAIKRWSRPIDLNNPSPRTTGLPRTFSSYAFALMTVGFLQHLGLLHNLQEDIPPSIAHRFFWNRKPVHRCDMRFKWSVPPISANKEVSVQSLFLDWFNFWAEFDADKQIVDICKGGILPRVEGNQSLYVIDPFIRVRNVAQNISKEVFVRFQKECKAASTELRERSEKVAM